MYVNGSLHQGQRQLTVRNPFNGEVAGSVSKDTPADVEAALASLKSYDHSLTGEKRSQILRATAEELLRSKDEFARRISQESGMCIKDSRGEVDRSCGNLLVAAEEPHTLHGEALQNTSKEQNKVAMTMRQPRWAVCATTP